MRELDHELHHQNFDQIGVSRQAEIAKLILSKYKIEDILKNVLNEPTYEIQFEQLQKQYGQQTAEIYVVNEFIGHVMSYTDYPPPEVKNPKEHFTEQQWAEFLSEEIKNGGTEETLTRQFKGRPDLIVPSGSAAYDVSDKFFFEMQRSGVLIPDDLKQILEKYGLTPNTFSNLLFHVVFSVKERMRLLNKDTRNRLYPYISGIASKNSFKILCIGGTNDHIHILLSLNPEISISKAVQLIKGNSSKWLRENFTDLNMFSWQEGYSVFTVSKSQVGIIQKYINNQEEHHKKMSFEEEYVELLKRNNIDFNPKYLF